MTSDGTFTFRVEESLKVEFTKMAKALDRNAAQLLRDFMREFIHKQHEKTEYDTWFRKQVELGRAAADRGELYSLDEAQTILAAKKAEIRARIRK
jgi:predicted transcriptional regulator